MFDACRRFIDRHQRLLGSLLGFFAVFGLFGLRPTGMRSLCETQQTVPYHYLAGEGVQKDRVPKLLTFLQWNISFLPMNLPLKHGGVAEAMERVEPIARFIEQADADIVALQEAHDTEAVRKLAERLKAGYAHIYYNIGPVDLHCADQDVHSGEQRPLFNSGLMVLSKYSLVNVNFEPFDSGQRQWQIKKGFFDFTVVAKGKRLAHVVVTHLQPYNEKKDELIREEQIKEIVAKLQSMISRQSRPIANIVLGDLNIAWGSEEYARSSLPHYFEEAYTDGLVKVTGQNSTATDALTHFRNPEVSAEPDAIIDYFLLFKDGCPGSIRTQAMSAYITDPDAAEKDMMESLSDHKALFSTLLINSCP